MIIEEITEIRDENYYNCRIFYEIQRIIVLKMVITAF